MPCSTRTRLVVATPTQSAPPISIFTHGKRPVSRVSAQYTENLGVMVECPWALTRDTTVITRVYGNNLEYELFPQQGIKLVLIN